MLETGTGEKNYGIWGINHTDQLINHINDKKSFQSGFDPAHVEWKKDIQTLILLIIKRVQKTRLFCMGFFHFVCRGGKGQISTTNMSYEQIKPLVD